MKKFTFALMMMLAYAGFTMAQTVENFESIKMNSMEFGTTGKMTVVANPDPIGNPSAYCVEFLRPGKTNDGKPWSGFWSPVLVAVDVTVNKYVHVKVWKSRISPIRFKLQDGVAGTLEITSMNPQTLTNAWEDIVFDFSAKTGTYPIVAFMPDFEDPLIQADDLTMYFDEIYVNNDPLAGSAAVQVIENYEILPLTPFGTGLPTLIPNPDKSGINKSDYVIDYLRPWNDVAWSGFFSELPASTVFDVTTNHYVHVKVWKPRVSEMRFKLEAGTSGTKEFPNINTFTDADVSKWVDMVFNVNEFTGTYPKIGILADFNGAALTADINLYIDDIVVNNEPKQSVAVTFNVDMHGSKLTTDQKVYIAGNITGWAVPDTKPEYEMLDADKDSIYSISMVVTAGDLAFKFFKGGSGWSGGEWAGDPNRTLTVTKDEVVNCLWGQIGFVGKRENALAGKINMYPNPVRDELTIDATANVSKIIITNTLGKVVGNMVYSNNKTINTSNLSKGMYFVTFIDANGAKVTQKLIKD